MEKEKECECGDCKWKAIGVGCNCPCHKPSVTEDLTVAKKEVYSSEEWEKEFRERFMNDVDWGFQFDMEDFKSFISSLLSSHSQKLVSELKEKIVKEIESEKYIPNEETTGFNIEECQNYRYGFKSACEKIINLLK